jgi:hypothetical protein
MESSEGRRIAAALAPRVANGAEAAQIAEAVVATWQAVDAALSPIIGHVGVAAMYKRSVYLNTAVHPWLSGTRQGVHAGMDLASLKSVLEEQSNFAAAAGGDALLQTFIELLTTLVGPSLTERLLRSVWAESTSGPSARDK